VGSFEAWSCSVRQEPSSNAACAGASIYEISRHVRRLHRHAINPSQSKPLEAGAFVLDHKVKGPESRRAAVPKFEKIPPA
jgi:hypothetical protein